MKFRGSKLNLGIGVECACSPVSILSNIDRKVDVRGCRLAWPPVWGGWTRWYFVPSLPCLSCPRVRFTFKTNICSLPPSLPSPSLLSPQRLKSPPPSPVSVLSSYSVPVMAPCGARTAFPSSPSSRYRVCRGLQIEGSELSE